MAASVSVNPFLPNVPKFPFDPPENNRKSKVFCDVFGGIKREHWEELGLTWNFYAVKNDVCRCIIFNISYQQKIHEYETPRASLIFTP